MSTGTLRTSLTALLLTLAATSLATNARAQHHEASTTARADELPPGTMAVMRDDDDERDTGDDPMGFKSERKRKVERDESFNRAPFTVAASVTTGLGMMSLFAAGVTWLAAFGEAQKLDDECPDRRCVRGTPGGDSYETARDAERASGVLVGIGMPLIAAGISLFAISAAVKPKRRSLTAAPYVSPSGGGASVAVSF